MKFTSVAVMGVLLAASVSASAAAPVSIFQKGRAISGTCSAKYQGKVVMSGKCSGLGHGSNLFVTADADGCSLEISRSGAATLSAYRNTCGESDLDSSGVSIGKMRPVGNCLVGPTAKVCLKAN